MSAEIQNLPQLPNNFGLIILLIFKIFDYLCVRIQVKVLQLSEVSLLMVYKSWIFCLLLLLLGRLWHQSSFPGLSQHFLLIVAQQITIPAHIHRMEHQQILHPVLCNIILFHMILNLTPRPSPRFYPQR